MVILSNLYLKDRYESLNNMSVEDNLPGFFLHWYVLLHVLQQGDDVKVKRLC